MKQVLISMLFLSASLLANAPLHHDGARLGDAYHNGSGKVFHDGDFIEFGLAFTADCYADQAHAWDNVARNASTFLEWLDAELNNNGENIEWNVEPLNVWHESNYYGNNEDACDNTFKASQEIKVFLKKAEGTKTLHGDAIQAFYARLQTAIWPLNHVDVGHELSHVITKIESIEKGIYEETADDLRIAAKIKAQAKATKDFLAFLGADYKGTWWLQSVDFREGNHASYYKESLDVVAAPGAIGGGPVFQPAQLKLKPLSLLVSGNFHFVFDVSLHNMN